MVPGPCSHPGAAGLQSYGAWVDWEVCVVEKGASLAAQLLAMLTAKLCTAAAVLHLFCAVFMIFTDPRCSGCKSVFIS